MNARTRARKKHQHARAAWRKRRPAKARGEPAPADGQEVSFNPKDLLRVYLAKDWDALSHKLVTLLTHFARYTRRELSAEDQFFVDMLVESLLYFFTKADYVISDAFAEEFLRLQPVVANLVATSSFQTTDPQVRVLLRTRKNLVKLLTLCNARNSVHLDRKRLFGIDPYFASMWYASYFFSTESFATETTYRNMREHVEAVDPRFVLFGQAATNPFFKPTYINFEAERPVKEQINQLIQSACASIVIRNRPRKDRIAVITNRWTCDTSVYRSLFPFVAALKGDYELTLVHLGPEPAEGEKLDDSLFADVRRVQLQKGGIAMEAVADNDFQLVYYPDVGMLRESIYLSNLRLAPIQVTGYGHPVSTFGSRIDYFIGGADVELADQAEINYSERLVLIPGIGAHPVWPDYEPRRPPKPTDGIVVNCPWAPMKINHPLLGALQEVIRRAGRKVVFQFFAGTGASRLSAFIPFCGDLESVLGKDHVRVVGPCCRDEYMERMETGDLSADSYPFGGYNTIVDSLYLGKPIVTREGTKFYNRAAGQLLRKLGLEDLVVATAEEYAQKLLGLIQDDAAREDVCNRIRRMDLRAKLSGSRGPEYFKKAIDFLIANHERLQADGSKAPIFIR